MPRPHRRDAESGIHHVMNRGVDRQAIFWSDGDRLAFGDGLATAHAEHGVTTLAYCLMGNHHHLLLRAPPGELSPAMHQLTSTYSHRSNARLGRDGPLFRGRFHSIPVETDSYLLWVTRYIHRNPLDLPGVGSPEDHRWSSYRAYIGLRPVAPFLDVETVLDLAGGRRSLAALTADPSVRPSADDVDHLVECALAVDDLAHATEMARSRLARTVMVLLEARTTDCDVGHAVRAALGQRSSEASRVALVRAEKRQQLDPVVARTLAWVEGELRTDGARHRPYGRVAVDG